ncbi:MAG: hypothetical protein ACOC2Q_04190 [Spirochaetota bacterium]
MAVSEWIAGLDIWPLVLMLIPYFFLFRSRGQESREKRFASLAHAIAVFAITSVAALVLALGLTDAYLFAAIALVAALAYALRERVFPYRLSCPQCNRRYELFTSDFKIVYLMDDHLCDDCRAANESASEPLPPVGE